MFSLSRFTMSAALAAAVTAATLMGNTPVAVAEDAAENPVVATVNGVEIRRAEVMENVSLLPPQMQGLPPEILEGVLVNAVVDRKLVALDARSAGLEDDAEVKATMARVMEQVLQRTRLNKVVEAAITDEAVTTAYGDLIASFKGREDIHARHILMDTEDDAKAVIVELDGGADFAELAKTKSTGPSGPDGGDLGFFGEGAMVPEFATAAFALDAGAYTKEPVQTQFGWHVIKVEAKRPATPPTLEESRAKIEEQLGQAAATTYIDGLRKGAKIDILIKVPGE